MTQQTQTKQLPKGWKKTTLGEEFEIIMGQSPSSETYNKQGNGLPFFQGKKEFTNLSPKTEIWCTKPKKIAEKDDVLLSVRAPIGDVNISPEKCGIGRGLAAIKYSSKENSKLIFYLIKSKENELKKRGTGTTFQAITKPRLFSLPIEIPESRKERELIVSAIESNFSKIDDAIKNLKSAKKKIQLYRKAVLKKAFEGENFKTFPEIISKEKHSMKRGPFGGSLKKEIFVPSGYLVYEQYHPINNNFDFGRYFITDDKFEEMKAFSVKPRDLLISCSGTIGKIAEVPKDNFRQGIINQALLKITLDENKVNKKYFKYLFESDYIQKYLTKVSRGVAIKNVPSVKELKQIKFPIPNSIKTQQKIVSFIESKFSVIDKVEEAVNNSLAKAEKLKKSILKSAFEGRLVKE